MLQRLRQTLFDTLYLKLLLVAVLAALLVWVSRGKPLGAQYPGKTILRFEREPGFPEDRDAWQAIADDFERLHPNVKVICTGDIKSDTRRILEVAGKLPDVVCSNTFQLYDRRNSFKDLGPLIERDRDELKLDDFYPTLLESCRCEDRQLMLPYFFNVSLLYYNVDAFEDAHVPLPNENWTWEDYVAAGQKLAKFEGDGSERKQVRFGTGIVLGWWVEWLTHINMAGGNFISDDWKRCETDTPQAIAGLQLFCDLVHKYKVSPEPRAIVRSAFLNQQTAMEYTGHTQSWITYRSHAKFRWDVTLLPRGIRDRSGGERVAVGLGINTGSQQPELAWEFVKFATNSQSIARLIKVGMVPVRKSSAEVDFLKRGADGKYLQDPQHKEMVFEALKYTREQSRLPEFFTLALYQAQPHIDAMLRNEITPQQCGQRIAQQCGGILKMLGRVNPDYHPNSEQAAVP